MPVSTKAEAGIKADPFYTSGVGVFNVAGVGSTLHRILWETSGIASGHWTSVLDTQSGTAASGLWLATSGVRTIAMNTPILNSGHATDPVMVDYGITMRSGLAVVISGGAANAVRALVVYSE